MSVIFSKPSPSLIRPALNTLTSLSPRRCSSLVRPTICTCHISPSIPRSQDAPSITHRAPGSQQPRRTAFSNIIAPSRCFTAAATKYHADSSTSPLPNQDDRQDPAASDTAVEPPDYLSEGELKVFEKLKLELQPLKLEVQDISGGCGSMYGLDIISPRFKGLSVIQQHKLVNGVLKEELKEWHGVQLKTKAP